MDAPKVYVISRNSPPALIRFAVAAFTITPLSCVLISDSEDGAMASEFGGLILKMASLKEAVEFGLSSFMETQMPTLIIGATEGISAAYSVEHWEKLPWPDQDLMPN